MQFKSSGYLPGGESYSLAELGTPPEAIPTTLATVDKVTGGGIWPGAVWAIVCARGMGATNLSLQIALEAVHTGRHALVVNDHVHSAALRERVVAIEHLDSTDSADEEAVSRLRFASWVPDPESDELGRYGWNMFRFDPLLIVLDTITDADSPPSPRRDATANHERLLHWRTWARHTGKSILTTVRLNDTTGSRSVSRDAWQRHVAMAAVVEACDVILTLEGDTIEAQRPSHLRVLASRVGPTAQVEIHAHHRDMRIRELQRS